VGGWRLEKGRNRGDGLEAVTYLRCSCCLRQDRTKSMIKGQKTASLGALRGESIVEGHCHCSTVFGINSMDREGDTEGPERFFLLHVAKRYVECCLLQPTGASQLCLPYTLLSLAHVKVFRAPFLFPAIPHRPLPIFCLPFHSSRKVQSMNKILLACLIVVAD